MTSTDSTISLSTEANSVRQYQINFTNTSLSISLNITTILTWIKTELEEYTKQEKISIIRDLENSFSDGKVLLCLANKYFSEETNPSLFETLLEVENDKERIEYVYQVFQEKLNIAPPLSTDPITPVPLYIAKIRQAILLLDNDAKKNNHHHSNLFKENDIWSNHTQEALMNIQIVKQQLQDLTFHSSSASVNNNNNIGAEHDTNIILDNQTESCEDDNKHSNLSKSQTNNSGGWEEDLAIMEQQLLNLDSILNDFHDWANKNIDIYNDNDSNNDQFDIEQEKNRRFEFIQIVDDAYKSLQNYLDDDQHVLAVFRKRAHFTQATTPIRQDLEWVQAEMLKTTTTDKGIQELESRVNHAGSLLNQLIQQYQFNNNENENNNINMLNENDHYLQQEQVHAQFMFNLDIEALVKKYHLVQSWVEDVRVWFVEAQRIRNWIEERIDKLDNNVVPDAINDNELVITFDEVDQLYSMYDTMEKEVEQFNKEDMSRLRAHVKDLTTAKTKDKDLSPADTTTIEITFTTLTILDRLMFKLRQRSYDLQVLKLRALWENEYLLANDWIQRVSQQVEYFIENEGRWQNEDDEDQADFKENKELRHALKMAIIDKLLEFETKISGFDQGQFTNTVSAYEEFDGASRIELPNHLESRQVGIEESFEILVNRVSFSRKVVEQYLAVAEYMDQYDQIYFIQGEELREKLYLNINKCFALFLDDQLHQSDLNQQQLDLLNDINLVNKHHDFQEQVIQIITETAEKVPYTESTSQFENQQQVNNIANDIIHTTIKSKSDSLMKMCELLEQLLNQYQEAIKWYNDINSTFQNIQSVNKNIDDDTKMAGSLCDKISDIFGDQALQLNEYVINNATQTIQDTYNKPIQQFENKLEEYHNLLDSITTDQVNPLQLYLDSTSKSSDSSSFLPLIMDSTQYIERDLNSTKESLELFSSILKQCKESSSIASLRYSWESHYNDVLQFIIQHQQKCHQLMLNASWAIDDNLDNSSLISLEQQWDGFKNESVPTLHEYFDKLITFKGEDTNNMSSLKWNHQQQMQNNLISKVAQMDDFVLSSKKLLNRYKSLNQFLSSTSDLQENIDQSVNHLKQRVLNGSANLEDLQVINEDIDAISVEKILKKSEEVWSAWLLSESTNSIDDMISLFKEKENVETDRDSITFFEDMNSCSKNIQKEANDSYEQIKTSIDLLKKWLNADKDLNQIRDSMIQWNGNVDTLNDEMLSHLESLETDKKNLAAYLKSSTSILENHVFNNTTKKDKVNNIESLMKQWLQNDYKTLYTQDKEIKNQLTTLYDSLDNGSNKSLGTLVKYNYIHQILESSYSKCEINLQSYVGQVLYLINIYDQRFKWETNMAHLHQLTNSFRDQLDSVSDKNDRWMKTAVTSAISQSSVSLDELQKNINDLSNIMNQLNSQFNNDNNDNDKIYVNEINDYDIMENLYHQSSDASITDLDLPKDITNKRSQWQTSVNTIKESANQLEMDFRWLSSWAEWSNVLDHQMDAWNILISDANLFIEQDAKWSTSNVNTFERNGSNDDSDDQLSNRLTDLQHHGDILRESLHGILNEFDQWKSNHCNGISNNVMINNNKLDIIQQKVETLKEDDFVAQNIFSFASDMLHHRHQMENWLNDVLALEKQGEMTKSILLNDNAEIQNDAVNDKDPQSLVLSYDQQLESTCDTRTMNFEYPVQSALVQQKLLTNNNANESKNNNNSNNHKGIKSTNESIRQFAFAKMEQLKDLSTSLHDIMNTKERSSRLKALVDNHIKKVEDAQHWSENIHQQLQVIINNGHGLEVTNDSSINKLDETLIKLNELDSAINVYSKTNYASLKDSTKQCITAIENEKKQSGYDSQDDDNQLIDRIKTADLDLENQWQSLLKELKDNYSLLKGEHHQAKIENLKMKMNDKFNSIDHQLLIMIEDLDNDSTNDLIIDNDKLKLLQDEIQSFKFTELKQLEELIHSNINDNDDNNSKKDQNLLLLEDMKQKHQLLENNMQNNLNRVQLQKWIQNYKLLTVSLLDHIGTAKQKLLTLCDDYGSIKGNLDLNTDQDQNIQFKTIYNNIMEEFKDHDHLFEKENELYSLSGSLLNDLLQSSDGDNNKNNKYFKLINDQHQLIESKKKVLDKDIANSNFCYQLLTQWYDLYSASINQVSSAMNKLQHLLDSDIDIINNDKSEINNQLEYIHKLLTIDILDDVNKINQLVDDFSNNNNNSENIVAINEINCNTFQQRRTELLIRMKQMDDQVNKKKEIQQSQLNHQVCQELLEKIKSIGENEISKLELQYKIWKPQHDIIDNSNYSNDNDNDNSDDRDDRDDRDHDHDMKKITPIFEYAMNNYLPVTKDILASEQKLQHLITNDIVYLKEKAKSLDISEKDTMDLNQTCQTIVNDWDGLIKQNQFMIDTIRRALGLKKSADNIIPWLNQFYKAVDSVLNNITKIDNNNHNNDNTEFGINNDTNQLEIEINNLDKKLGSFESIIHSFNDMNQAVQSLPHIHINKNIVEDQLDNEIQSYWKKMSQSLYENVNLLWEQSIHQLNDCKKKSGQTQSASLVSRKLRHMKSILNNYQSELGELEKNNYLNYLTDDDGVTHSSLSLDDQFKKLPREFNISSMENNLEVIENELMVQWQQQHLYLDELIQQYQEYMISNSNSDNNEIENGNSNDKDHNITEFIQQQYNLEIEYNQLLNMIKNAQELNNQDKAIGKHMHLMDDLNLLLDSMDEVILKSDPHKTTTNENKFSRAELQAQLIELNARFKYYENNIEQSLRQVEQFCTSMQKNDMNNKSKRCSNSIKIIEGYKQLQKSRWKQLVDRVSSRQHELKKLMDSTNKTENGLRTRTSSIPTRKGASTATPSRLLSSPTKASNLRYPKPTLSNKTNSSSSTTSSSTATSSSLLTIPSNNNSPLVGHRLRHYASSSSLSVSNSASRLQPHSVTSSSSIPRPTTSGLLNKKKSKATLKTNNKTSTTPPKNPNRYVPQPGNNLDMEVSRIVNEAPYKVTVKMVPGEVGRYLFGDVNPKLVYCRVLKSKMVMVRVGGGWTELSQFLREHAFLESELFVPKKQLLQQKQQQNSSSQKDGPIVQEAYLEAMTSKQKILKEKMEAYQRQQQQSISSSTSSNGLLAPPIPKKHPSMKLSRSTPSSSTSTSTSTSTTSSKGYKEGDKFYAVDRHGNQLEVKMTKFKQQGGSLPQSIKNRRKKKLDVIKN